MYVIGNRSQEGIGHLLSSRQSLFSLCTTAARIVDEFAAGQQVSLCRQVGSGSLDVWFRA